MRLAGASSNLSIGGLGNAKKKRLRMKTRSSVPHKRKTTFRKEKNADRKKEKKTKREFRVGNQLTITLGRGRRLRSFLTFT